MINVILIDDEEPALLEMEFLLGAYPQVQIVGKYLNPVEGMEMVERLRPHAVFIDINMPGIDGMTISNKLWEKTIETKIIFVTAYEQYAFEAFRVEAMDYLLKPVSRERLDRTIGRLVKDNEKKPQILNEVLEIRCMGGLRLGWRDKKPIKWRTEKEKELFAFLLNHAGITMSKSRIIDELWNDYAFDRAISQLHNSIYHIKKTLREYGVGSEQIHISGHYCLSLGDVWYDRLLIEEKMKKRGGSDTIETLEEALQLFDGEYLSPEGWSWVEQERELLQLWEIDTLLRLTEKYIQVGMLYEAESMLKRAYRKNPFEENVTFMLMTLYKKTGDSVKAAKHYIEYEKTLQEELKIKPQRSITKLFESIELE